MTVRLLIGDCRERLAEIEAGSVDSCVTDPPYHLTSIVKRFGSKSAAPAKVGKTGAYARASRGFMGQQWDGGDVAFDPATWETVFRVLKPGAHLIAFSGTRTYHRMACAIEDAGFEIRDMILWHYGQGFPKSHDVKKGANDAACQCPGDVSLLGLRDAQDDPFRLVQAGESADLFSAMQRRSSGAGLGEAWAQGRGCTEADARYAGTEEPSMEGRGDVQASARQLQGRPLYEGTGLGSPDGADERLHNGTPPSDGAHVRLSADADGSGQPQGSQPSEQRPEQLGVVADERGSQAWGGWPICTGCRKPIVPEGLGTALKPATEPICLARKPLSGTVAQNVLRYGTGALNIDGCRIETSEDWEGRELPNAQDGVTWGGPLNQQSSGSHPLGRWPANIIHDGSEEVLAGFPSEAGGKGGHDVTRSAAKFDNVFQPYQGKAEGGNGFADTGSAARFFKECKWGEEDCLPESSDRPARCADSQCASCGTPIAEDPAATNTSGSKSGASPAIPVSTGSCGSSTPTPNPAPDVERQGSTGITPTIASCSKLNGSAPHVIASSTSLGNGERAEGGRGQEPATRFLYCPKATSAERGEGNGHPTVKPVDLMRWLVRLVTPKGGTVLDPFAGSGSTLIAADAEQFHAISCELSPEYAAIAEQRIRASAGMFADIEAAA